MFTPLSIDVPYERFPWATLGLLTVMTVVTGLTQGASVDDLAPFLFAPGDVQPWQSFTSLFFHAGFGHLLFNAIYLWVFGRYVEDRLGPVRFLLVFVAFGHVADWAYLWRGDQLPALGASGAIAGLMTLTLFQAPRARLKIYLVWLGRGDWHLPTWLFVGYWLFRDFWQSTDGADGIAHAAHLGGAFAGCLAAWVLRGKWLKGGGWHFPREPAGGARGAEAFDQLMKGEAAWKAIYERKRREREMMDD